MARTNWQDPKTSEIISPQISGLQEAVGKIEESIGIDSVAETGIPLSEVFIADDDRCRIFQAPEGKRNWLLSPTPIIKKNDAAITEGFEVDYGGGAIIFTNPILPTDTLTADVTYTVKVEGKGLSTNDYTTAEKDKLKNIELEANKTVINNTLTSTITTEALSANQGKILNDKIADLAGEGRTVENVKQNYDNIATLQQELDDIKNGMGGLKGNDMTARREILDIKLKLDEMKIVDYLNKTGIGFYDLFTDTANIDTANTTVTVDTTNANVTFTGTQLLKMLSQKFDNIFNTLELSIYDKEREDVAVDNTVSNTNQIQLTIKPDSIVIGDKFYYNGQAYTITGLQDV